MAFARNSAWMAASGAAVLLLTGCVEGGKNSVSGIQAESSSLAWADGDTLRVNKVDLQAATEAVEGKDFKEVANTGKWSIGDESFGAFALDSKGGLAGSMMKNQGIDPDTNLLVSGATLGQVVDGKFEAWPTAAGTLATGELTQVPGGDTDGENFIWYETPDTSIVATEWKIFAKHAGTAEPVLLAESSDASRELLSGAGRGDIEPIIHGDRVFWSTAMPTEAGGIAATGIFATDLASGGETRVVEPGAANPVALDGAIAALRLEHAESVSIEEDFGDLNLERASGIVLLNDDGTTSDLLKIADGASAEAGFGPLHGSGDSLSFSFDGETYVVDTRSKEAVTFEEPSGGYLTGAAHCGDMVTWTYSDANGEGIGKQYVYDTSAKTLRVVNEPELFGSSLCQGQFLSWSVRDSSNDGAYATDVVTKWNR